MQTLPYRLGAIAILMAAIVLTWTGWAVRNGQAMVAIFAMVLITVQIPAIDLIGPWILLNLTYANFALTLLIVASGLLFRHVTPIALIAGGVIAYAAFRWTENAFAPLVISGATLITLL
jgi:nitrogen fixation-related uncharacterized protein